MKKPLLSVQEERWHRELLCFIMPDHETEHSLDAITKLAATQCGVEISFISVVDRERVFIKSRFGCVDDEVVRRLSCCEQNHHNLEGLKNLSDPLSTAPHFSAGVSLRTQAGVFLGILGVMDRTPKTLSQAQVSMLESLAQHIVSLWEQDFKRKNLSKSELQSSAFQKLIRAGGWELLNDEVPSLYLSNEFSVLIDVSSLHHLSVDGMAGLFVPDDGDRVRQALMMGLAQGKSVDIEVRSFDNTQNEKWFRIVGEVLRNSAGEVLKLVGLLADITDSKRMELALCHCSAELETFSRGFEQYAKIVRTTPEGVITYVNDLFCEFSGYSREELIHQDHRILNSGYHPKSYFKVMWDTIKSGNPWRGQIRNRHKNGTFYWVDTIITSLKNSNGGIQEFISIRYDITEQKLHEEQLLLSQHRHRTLIHQSSDAIMTITPPDWRIRSANPATLRLFGCSSQEKFCQLAPWEIFPEFQPDGRSSAEVASEMSKIALKRGGHFFEWAYVKLDGSPMACTVLLSLVEEGYETFFQATIRDVSEQKKTERELQLSKRYLEIALESANLGIWELNTVTGVAHFDERWFRILDLTPDDWPKDWTTCTLNIHPDDLPRVNQELESFLSGSVSTLETIYRMHHLSGAWVSILSRAKVSEWDAKGRAVKLTGTILDVTVQKRRENVQVEISRLRGLYISLPNDRMSFFQLMIERLIHLVDGGQGLLGQIDESNNKRTLRIFAFSSGDAFEECVLPTFEFGIKELVSRKRHQLMAHVVEVGQPLAVNDQALLRSLTSGHHPDLENFLALPIHHGGQLMAVIGIANSEHGFDESLISDLRPFMDFIGEMIHARQADDELAHQKQLAMHASKLASIGQLAAGVGHEINNPLAIITGQISMTRTELGDRLHPVVSNRLRKMEIAAGRIVNIVKGLRTFARSDGETLTTFDFFTSIEETVAMLEEIFAREQVDLKLTGQRAPMAMHGNRGQLQQVLVNLISNAKDATTGKDLRKIVVAVSYTSTHMRVAVSDNGWGIPEEIRDKILEPFFTTKDVHKGTGIGLALVNTILKEHKGLLQISTKVGEGSTFTFDLPVTNVTEVLAKRTIPHTLPKQRFDVSVLLVDDEEGLREVLKHMLSNLCAEVVTASDAHEGLRHLRERAFDLVISDIQMPVIDGFMFLELLRRETLPLQPRFVFITGGIEMSPAQEAIAGREADGFLPKPFDPEMIAAKLLELSLKKVS